MDRLSPDDIASLVYLSLFAVVLGGIYLVQSRLGLSRMVQQGAIWLFIFIGVIAAVGLWEDIKDDVMPRQSIATGTGGAAIITAPRRFDGHYYLTLRINDTPVEFMVDTGASSLVLTLQDAEKIGLNMDDLVFLGRANTANGQVRTAPVRLRDVAIGPVHDQNVRALVNGGAMEQSLLGMTYLETFGRIEITGQELRLTR